MRRGWRAVAALAGAGALAAGIIGGAAAAGADGASVIRIEVNGQVVTFDAPPVMLSDHVYLPIRYVAQALGLPVQWDQSAQTVYIGTAPTTGGQAGGSFDYQGLHYAVEGLAVRTLPGQDASAGAYWIVSYSITNAGTAPVDVSKSEPPLVLFGPGGAQLAPADGLGGAAPSTINPGIAFSSYLVFNVPANAIASAYSLGFNTYHVVSGTFTTTPISAGLPPAGSTSVKTQVGSTYSLTNFWNQGVQQVSIGSYTETTAIVPDLKPTSFDPGTSFWIVNFGVTNQSGSPFTFHASDIALSFNGTNSIAAYPVTALPGYLAPSNLSGPGVSLAPGTNFDGALLFEIPAGTPTTAPALAFTANGVRRVISLQPCTGGVCPPIGQ